MIFYLRLLIVLMFSSVFTLQRIIFCWFNVILGISTISFTGFGFGAGTSSAPATGTKVLLIASETYYSAVPL